MIMHDGEDELKGTDCISVEKWIQFVELRGFFFISSSDHKFGKGSLLPKRKRFSPHLPHFYRFLPGTDSENVYAISRWRGL
jgi:hypothetical protein